MNSALIDEAATKVLGWHLVFDEVWEDEVMIGKHEAWSGTKFLRASHDEHSSPVYFRPDEDYLHLMIVVGAVLCRYSNCVRNLKLGRRVATGFEDDNIVTELKADWEIGVTSELTLKAAIEFVEAHDE